jgi:hypothetical protein
VVALARARSRAPLGTRRRLLRRHVVCERKHVRPAADADAAGQHEAERGGADAAAAAARRLTPERTPHTRTRTRTRVRAWVRLRASGNAQVAARIEGVKEQRLRKQNGEARPGARSSGASASSSSSFAAAAACCGTLRGRAAAGWGRAA